METDAYFSYLHGYTLAIAIPIIAKIGPPAEIAELTDDDQRGPLLVTLATELACEMVRVLYHNLFVGRWSEAFEQFLEISGGTPYQTLKRDCADLLARKNSLIVEAQGLERRIIQRGYGQVCFNPAGQALPTIDNDFIEWYPSSLDADAKRLEAEYLQVASEYRTTLQELTVLETKCAAARNAIESSTQFQRLYLIHLQKQGLAEEGTSIRDVRGRTIRINFSDSPPVGGAAEILAKTDKAWWTQFTTKVANAVERTASAGFASLMMRDPLLIQCVADRQKSDQLEKFSWSGAWIHILTNPREFRSSLEWPAYFRSNSKSSEESIRQYGSKLRKEDKLVRAWLRDQGGAYHPSNWHDPSNDSKIFRDVYPAAQARNELYYCLCQSSAETFEPLISASYPLTRWEAWALKARESGPQYWRRNVK